MMLYDVIQCYMMLYDAIDVGWCIIQYIPIKDFNIIEVYWSTKPSTPSLLQFLLEGAGHRVSRNEALVGVQIAGCSLRMRIHPVLIGKAATANTPGRSIVAAEEVAVHLLAEFFGIDEFGNVSATCRPHVAGGVRVRHRRHSARTHVACLWHVHALLRKSPRGQVVAISGSLALPFVKGTLGVQIHHQLLWVCAIVLTEGPKVV